MFAVCEGSPIQPGAPRANGSMLSVSWHAAAGGSRSCRGASLRRHEQATYASLGFLATRPA